MVTSERICSAKNKVNIFWKTMYDPILNNELFIASIKDALSRGVGFIVMEQQVDPVPSELENIFRSSNMIFKQLRAPSDWDYNVISSDNTAYVFWSRLPQKGVVCFNNPTRAYSYRVEEGEITR
jgi:hypothetical protein